MNGQNTEPPGRDHPLPELLAPAGSPEAFRAAIAAGADAVYLGGKRFGARKYAENFEDPAIEDALSFAHGRGVKVYVTVNTLIHDRELKSALNYIVWLYSIGVDAILVQDSGIAALAHTIAPGLPLHASTQMTIHNARGVRAAADLGFSRIVLARELTLEEIETIAKVTKSTRVGLEVFAHGALCFSYSGQCLLSSVIGGRSGNRGMCAQPCRKPYTLVAGKPDAYGRPERLFEIATPGEYLLSPKDLCAFPRLSRLVHSPVAALKIEGRMKSPEYVAVVTAAYRKALDAIAEARSPDIDREMVDLALAFNRGFTEGYIFNRRHSAIMGIDRPDNRGVRIGTVVQYREHTREALVDLSTGLTPVAGDGLFISDPDRKEKGRGFPLNRTPERSGDHILLPVPGEVRSGSEVFLTSRVALSAKARRILAGEYRELRPLLPVDCTVTVDGEGAISIDGMIETRDAGCIPVAYRGGVTLKRARTHPLTSENLLKNLKKTGGTQFFFRRVVLRYAGDRFAPVSVINTVRREFLSRAEQVLIEASLPQKGAINSARSMLVSLAAATGRSHSSAKEARPDPRLVIRTDSLAGVMTAAETGCDGIWFGPAIPDNAGEPGCRARNDAFPDQLRSAVVVCRDARIPLAWSLPGMLRQDVLETILADLPGLYHEGLKACIAGNIGTLAGVRSSCPAIDRIGSERLNIFNHASACYAASFCSSVMISPELSLREIRELVMRTRKNGCRVGFALVVQGTTEAMVSENCIRQLATQCSPGMTAGPDATSFMGIRDSTGRIFPVRTDDSCRTHILNSDETCLIDFLPGILDAGVGILVIDARGRTPAYIREAARIYRNGLDMVTSGSSREITEGLNDLKEQIRRISYGQITAGHLLMGLKEA